VTPLPSQRARFGVPEDLAYLDCAYLSPLLDTVRAAGHRGLDRKAAPWEIRREHFFDEVETVRARFAALVGGSAEDVAILPSTSYGTALAAANLEASPGRTILVLEDEHASSYLGWHRKARESGALLVTVPRPADGDWTASILERIGPATAVVASPACHWTDGSAVDLEAVGAACRAVGAALVVDGTQSVGAVPFDVARVQPDFLIVSAYKWLLCPYTLAFLWAAPHRQGGRPLEEHGFCRAGVESREGATAYTLEFAPGARRYDMGERSNWVSLPMAAAALEALLAWRPERIAATLAGFTRRIAEAASERGLRVPPDRHRAPHLLGLRGTRPFGPDDARALAARGVRVSARGGALRASPHLWCEDADLDRLLAALDQVRRSPR
jgi:selenocysteine lyase/cysteine desulfurase